MLQFWDKKIWYLPFGPFWAVIKRNLQFRSRDPVLCWVYTKKLTDIKVGKFFKVGFRIYLFGSRKTNSFLDVSVKGGVAQNQL